MPTLNSRTTAMPQRTKEFEEVSLGLREDDAIHPSVVIVPGDCDLAEKPPLTGHRPPGGHRGACDYGPSPLDTHGCVLEDLVQYFRREGHGCAQVGCIGSLWRPFMRFTTKKEG